MTGTSATDSSRRGRRRERTRRQLLDAARQLIADHGVEGIRIHDLTSAADLGAGTFYIHFSSKDDLVAAVVTDAIDDVAHAAVGEAAAGDDPAVTIARASVRVVRLAFEQPELARLLVNLIQADKLFGASVTPYARSLVETGVASGRFQVPDLDMALTALVGATVAVIREALEGTYGAGIEVGFAEFALVSLGLGHDEARRISAGQGHE